jgi:arylsulfatase A-like enzyme
MGVPTQTHLVNGERQGLGGTLAVRAIDLPDEALVDARTVNDAVQHLQKAAASKKPFFLAVGFMAPDFRMAAPKSWLDRYGKVPVTVQPGVKPPPEIPEAALWSGILPTREVTVEERRQLVASYRAMTSFMDAQAGKVLDALEQMKLTENTLVIFTSVTGFHLGDHGNLWGASSLFERAVRVPLIIAGPGVIAGQASPRVVELVDLAPTILDVCRVKPLRMTDGKSFAALLKQPTAASDEAALSFLQNYGSHSGVALRTEIATYVRWDGGASTELYNCQTDRDELMNLVSDKKMAPIQRKMEATLKKELATKK